MALDWVDRDAARLVGAIGHAFVVTDRDGTVVRWNEAAEAMYGWTAAEAAGRPLIDLIDPRSVVTGEDPVVDLGAADQVEDDLIARRKDGQPIAVRVVLRRITGDGGDTLGFASTSVEVTRERQAAETVRQLSDRLAIAASLAGIGTWEWNIETGEFVSDVRLRHLHGFALDEGGSIERWLDVVHPDDRAEMLAMTSPDSIGSDDLPEVRYRVVRSDGEIRWILGRGHVVQRDGDRPTCIAGVVVDITESQQTASRALSVLNAMIDGYFAVDEEWRFTYVNPAAEALLHRTREELVGECVWDMFPDARNGPFEENYRYAVESGESVEFEAFYPPPLSGWYEIRAIPYESGLSVYFRDITDRRHASLAQQRALEAERQARHATEQARARLEHAATHDPLTRLANRAALEALLRQQLRSPRRSETALLFCDLDRFKHINDTLGHAVGDELLRVAAQRVRSAVRDEDFVARLGGDEFVIAANVANMAAAEGLAARVLESFRDPIDLAGQRVVTTMSIGIALATDGSTASSLLSDADIAVYRAKRVGRDRFAAFDEQLRHGALRRLELEGELRRAVRSRELHAVYQPAFDLLTGTAAHVEALARWTHPTRGAISPAEFIPIAEETGLIVPLGDLVLETVRNDFPAGSFDDRCTLWVNVAGRQLEQEEFCQTISDAQPHLGVPLGLEVTETVLHSDPARQTLEQLSRLGVRIAIDDFGTGHSSLGRLTTYPIDVIKVDRSFIDGLDEPRHRAVAEATIKLAHALGAVAIAEGVEHREQLDILRRMGCDFASGYYLARPSSRSELTDAIRAGEELVSGALRTG